MITATKGTLEYGPVLLLQLLATFALLFLSGRAIVGLLAIPYSGTQPGPLLNPNFVAFGAGNAVNLLLIWALKSVGVIAFGSTIAGLLAIVAIASLFHKNFREFLFRPLKSFNFLLVVYLVLVASFMLLLRPQEYPVRETSMYITQGFDLFTAGRDPTEIPQFGTIISLPVLYGGHAIATLFGLFSQTNHFFYYAYGEYILNALLGMTIPIGAYLFFKRFIQWGWALAAAIAFCGVILDYKVWSLRGESIAWIAAFGYLIVQADLQDYVRRHGVNAYAIGATILLAALYFTTSLSHGVTALIATIVSAGLAGHFILTRFKEMNSRSFRRLLALIGLFAIAVISLNVSFAFTYSRNPQLIEDTSRRPPAGDADAALEYDNAYLNLPLETQRLAVLPSPPYVSLTAMAQITAFLPAASLFSPSLAKIGLREFPSLALQNLQRVSLGARVALAALFAFCCFVNFRYASRVPEKQQALFLASSGGYVILIVLSLYLDLKSVSLFPIAAVRRTFIYEACFYWSAIALTIGAFIIRPAGIYVKSLRLRFSESLTKPIETLKPLDLFLSLLLFWLPWTIETRWRQVMEPKQKQKTISILTTVDVVFLLFRFLFQWLATIATRYAHALGRGEIRREHVVAVCLIPLWLFYSINSGQNRPLSVSWLAGRVLNCLQYQCTGEAGTTFGHTLLPLFEAARYVRENTSEGDWVYTNLSSENQFYFLSYGRPSLLDGASVFQLYFVLKGAARRMTQFAMFAKTADLKYLEPYNVKLFVLYKHLDCGTAICYGNRPVPTSFPAFKKSADFEKVLENEYYLVLKRRLPHTTEGAAH